MKKILLPIIVILILSGCSGNDIIQETKKQDFLIDTMSFSGFTQDAALNKSGRIMSSQNIQLTAKANGKVRNILVRDGDSVIEGQIIAILDDTITNYGLSLDTAINGLNRAEISYDSNKITLDKSVFDADQNYIRMKNSLQALIDDSAENIKKAENDLENTDVNIENSKSRLEIKKIENSITKAELDYENKIIADNETIETFYSSVKKEYNSMVIFLDDVIQFSDTLYGVSDLNNDKNDNFDTFLGAKDTSQKNDTKLLIKNIINFSNEEFSNINIDEIKTSQDLENVLVLINSGYSNTKILLNEIEKTLNNSIDSTNSFSLSDIANYNSNVNLFQSALQGNYTGFISFESGINSFLRTYKNTQLSVQKSIDLMKKDLEIFKKSITISSELAEVSFNKVLINSDDAISNMQIQLSSAENTLSNAKQIRDVYLRNIKNEINAANIQYKRAINEFEKLTVISPIEGTISTVNIDIGQELNIGSPIFSIVNNTESEVNISFNRDELNLISEGDIVYIIDEDNTYTGSIYSLSQSADNNLKYKSVIKINEGINLIGNIVMVEVPITLNNTLIPLDIVKIKDSGIGTINTLKEISGTGSTGTGVTTLKIEQLDVQIGDIYTDKVEILNMVEGSKQIILNYVDNFDKDKFQLKIK